MNGSDCLSEFENLNKNKRTYLLPLASLVCQACHDDTVWLPPPSLLQLNLPSNVSPNPSLSYNACPVLTLNRLSDLPVQSASLHSGHIRSAIIAFKYREAVSALPVLVHALRQLPRPTGYHANNSVILPTPTTNNRLVNRGFDPVTILAHYLSKHWGIPIWRGMSRNDDTTSQKGLDRHERHQNIDNAFHMTLSLPNKRIILFDDVITTGATLSALAMSLQKTNPAIYIAAYTVTGGK